MHALQGVFVLADLVGCVGLETGEAEGVRVCWVWTSDCFVGWVFDEAASTIG